MRHSYCGQRVRTILLFILISLLLVASGCSSESSSKADNPPAPKVLHKATLAEGAPIPTPKGPVVLVIKDAGNPNRGKDLALDMKTLESMGTVQYKVNDTEGMGKILNFSGPLLATVFKYADVQGTTIAAKALNDYNIDIPADHLDKYPLMLATQMEGKRMNLGDLGPTRIVYPNVDYKIGATYAPFWIWSLKSLALS